MHDVKSAITWGFLKAHIMLLPVRLGCAYGNMSHVGVVHEIGSTAWGLHQVQPLVFVLECALSTGGVNYNAAEVANFVGLQLPPIFWRDTGLMLVGRQKGPVCNFGIRHRNNMQGPASLLALKLVKDRRPLFIGHLVERKWVGPTLGGPIERAATASPVIGREACVPERPSLNTGLT